MHPDQMRIALHGERRPLLVAWGLLAGLMILGLSMTLWPQEFVAVGFPLRLIPQSGIRFIGVVLAIYCGYVVIRTAVVFAVLKEPIAEASIDGLVTRWLERTRSVPWAKVADISAQRGQVLIHTDRFRPMVIDTRLVSGEYRGNPERLSALLAKMRAEAPKGM